MKSTNSNKLFIFLISVLSLQLPSAQGADHLTRNVNGDRTGANNAETTLSPLTLNNGLPSGKQFKKISEYNVDEKIEAQPLVMSNIVYVATMNNSVYAFNAQTGQTIWIREAIDPSIPNTDMDIHKINTVWGISSTPVIDPDTKTLFVVTWARGKNAGDREFRIHALDLSSGKDKININGKSYFPIHGNAFNGNVPFRTGSPAPEFLKAGVAWEWYQKLRSGLALADAGNGRKALVVAFSMNGERIGDPLAGHGFVFAFETRGLLGQGGISPNPAIWSTSPNGALAGIWMAGGAPVVRGTNIYFTTGNGTIGVRKGEQNYAESFVYLQYTPAISNINNSMPSLDAKGFWTVFDDSKRLSDDQDIGSGGVMGVPGTKSIFGTGKDGVTYNIDADKLARGLDGMRHIQFGKQDGAGQSESPNTWDALVGSQPPMIATYFGPGGCTIANRNYLDKLIGLDCNLPNLNGTGKYPHNHSTPVYWEPVGDNPIVYFWGENNTIKAYNYNKATAQITGFRANGIDIASAGLPPPGGMPGGFMTLTSNNNSKDSGVIFATFPPFGNANGDFPPVAGRLVAYAAGDIIQQNGQSVLRRLRLDHTHNKDEIDYGLFSKFTPPVAANGMLYVSTYNTHADINGPAEGGTNGSVILFGFN